MRSDRQTDRQLGDGRSYVTLSVTDEAVILSPRLVTRSRSISQAADGGLDAQLELDITR